MISELFDLTGRKAVVTGAASGLGRVFAEGLSHAGADVAWLDRDAALLSECGSSSGGGHCRIIADLVDEADVDRAAAEIGEWSGGQLDILINNAGIATRPARLLDVSTADWDRALATNLRSVFLATRALLPALIASGRGSIVNISSYLGVVGAYPGFPLTSITYSASKAGLLGLTRQIAMEYAAEHVRCNAIAPGWHGGTRLGREREAAGGAAAITQLENFIDGEVPLGYRGQPKDLLGLLLYLAGDASSYVTGQVFAHDGGITAR
ncbi:MAG: SDR family NAD(P)-dependent oxidoreductase [Polynucleobacter sp.]|nr:SDR family NAD(P)-dependent oxidoreductase [Polynucleobacter sp.]